MGFCIYCNQNVLSDTSCPKCYRTITNKNDKKPFGSIFTAPKKEANQTDKWQHTYSKKAIFNNDSNATKNKQTRKMPQFTNTEVTTVMKICVHCKEKKETSKLGALSTTFYCHSCLTEKLTCPACQQHFTDSESRTQYSQHVYHTSCFKCNQCKCSLNPIFTVSDNEGNPSCRVCQFKNNHEQAPFSTSVSTPLRTLVTSRSTLTSSSKPIMESPLYTKYQQQRRASVLDAQNTLRQEQELRMDTRNLVSRSTSLIPTDTLLRKLSKEVTPNVEPQPEPSKSTPRRKRVPKRPCKECGLHVSKKDYRGLRIQTGQVICFHKNCLFCVKCHQHFDTLEFCTDGENFYHTECSNVQSPSLSASSSRQGTPVSEEDEAYPQTPPPQNTFFGVVSDSPTTTLVGQSFPDDLAKETAVANNTEILCNACGMGVADTYLELANNVYHKECLLCTGCNKTVPTDRQLVKYDNKLYCDHCTPNKNTKPSAGLKITINNDPPKRNPTVTTPSDIFKSRKKVLPRLGGVRTCARCNESMPFSDTQPGPNASRWHKKCLRCAGCNKQMDSAAHMTVNKENGLCLVHCRDCLDDTPTPRFIRKV